MIFPRFRAATRISRVNCAEMAGDRPRRPAYEFLALNVDFSNSSPDFLASIRGLRTRVSNRGTPLKWLFSAVGLSSVKIVADRHKHSA